MASREQRSDARAVFERDGYECQHCRTDGESAEDDLRLYAVGRRSVDAAHPRSLVTLCVSCFRRLDDPSASTAESRVLTADGLFRKIREITRTQSDAVSDVAEFASLATSLPATLEAGDRPPYAASRRRILFALAVVDAHFEAVDAADRSRLDGDVLEAVDAFADASARLRTRLSTVVDLVEAVASALGRCHVCFESLEADQSRCAECETARLDVTEWRDANGTVRIDALFSTLNRSLERTSATTERVTDGATALAETLAD